MSKVFDELQLAALTGTDLTISGDVADHLVDLITTLEKLVQHRNSLADIQTKVETFKQLDHK
jgi:cation transport regulator ChaC